MRIGIDIGSTTIKCVVLNFRNEIIHSSYERHFSKISEKFSELIEFLKENYTSNNIANISITGSAGMGLAEDCGIPFVQEVFATRIAIKNFIPDADAAIELGGEDAKILFLTGGLEVRMNGSCAGGTGAFIDQMASLLNVTPSEMDLLSAKATRQYTIASRCGVFAKSDIQPLLNQGANHCDMAASIFSSVVNQTVGGLARGRPITGKVIYLGGPLTFFSQLRKSFDKTLNTEGVCPENSLYYAALGAALCSDEQVSLNSAIEKLESNRSNHQFSFISPLFTDFEQYNEFRHRHSLCDVERNDPAEYNGPAFVGIDAGSTTIKIAIIDENGKLLHSMYSSNKGNPIPPVRDFLFDIVTCYPNIKICGSTSTGYGEELIKNAFSLDNGIVETAAHLAAAQHFLPDV